VDPERLAHCIWRGRQAAAGAITQVAATVKGHPHTALYIAILKKINKA
jgi:hypothetical protein